MGVALSTHADEKLTAFVELESAIGLAAIVLDGQVSFFQDSASLNGSESGGGLFPARFFASSRPPQSQNHFSGDKKGRTT